MAIKNNTFYNGNPHLKKAGVTVKLTKKQISEYIKCSNDIIYFAKTYCKIHTLDQGVQKFVMRKYQERIINKYNANRFNILLASRQTGKTTTTMTYILHYAIFNSDKYIGILANKGDVSKKILRGIKLMYESLPHFLQCGVEIWNKTDVEFGNGSRILSSATSSDSAVGNAYNLLYLDEFSKVDNASEFYSSTYPVISSGKTSKLIISSTPNGMELFYKLWTEATQGNNTFNPIRVDYWENEGYDDDWKAETIKNIGLLKFRREYGNEFFGSSNTLIEGSKIENLTHIQPLLLNDNYTIYEKPIAGHNYVACVDVSEGVGLDYSVINIMDITSSPYTQVALYRNNLISPILLSQVVNNFALEYNEALTIIETNTIGAEVARSLYYDYEYENMIITVSKGGKVKISSGFCSNIQYGLKMTKSSKKVGCANLKILIENEILIIKDENTISELQTFSINNKDSYSAEKGKNDDIVMTLVSFGWLTNEEYFKDMYNNNTRAELIKSNNIEDDLPPVGFYNDPTVGYN